LGLSYNTAAADIPLEGTAVEKTAFSSGRRFSFLRVLPNQAKLAGNQSGSNRLRL